MRDQVETAKAHWLDELCRLLSMPRTAEFGVIAARCAELRKLALGEKRLHRSNLESAERALADELNRVRNLRVVMGEVECEPAAVGGGA